MVALSEFQNQGINFNSYNLAGLVSQGSSHIIARTGAQNEDGRVVGKKPIGQVVRVVFDRDVAEQLRMRSHVGRRQIDQMLVPRIVRREIIGSDLAILDSRRNPELLVGDQYSVLPGTRLNPANPAHKRNAAGACHRKRFPFQSRTADRAPPNTNQTGGGCE